MEAHYTQAQLVTLRPRYTARAFLERFLPHLTPYFCFFYLYNDLSEPLHARVYYNDIWSCFATTVPLDTFLEIYNVAAYNRAGNSFKLLMRTVGCNGNCERCEKTEYCF
jgi:hypothetical protein